MEENINPLHAKLNPICHLLASLEAHHIFHVSGLRVNTRLQKQENLQSRSTSVEMRYSGCYDYEPINLQAALTQRMETEADIRSH